MTTVRSFSTSIITLMIVIRLFRGLSYEFSIKGPKFTQLDGNSDVTNLMNYFIYSISALYFDPQRTTLK